MQNPSRQRCPFNPQLPIVDSYGVFTPLPLAGVKAKIAMNAKVKNGKVN